LSSSWIKGCRIVNRPCGWIAIQPTDSEQMKKRQSKFGITNSSDRHCELGQHGWLRILVRNKLHKAIRQFRVFLSLSVSGQKSEIS